MLCLGPEAVEGGDHQLLHILPYMLYTTLIYHLPVAPLIHILLERARDK